MIDQLIIGGKASFDDFGASVSERKISYPKKKSIKKTVPFANVTYDFSKINGELYWEERTLEYIFEIMADTPEMLEQKKQAFSNWVMNVMNEKIYDPFIPDYHYLGTYEDQQILLQVTAQDGSSLLKASDAEQKKEAASCLGLVDVENWKQAAGTIMTADVLTDNRKGSMQIDVSSLDRGQTLFVPVAAIDGWTCRSKNKNVEITPVLGGFMGISIPEDTEILHFTFCPPGLKSGAVISAAAVLRMLLMVWFEEKICEKGSRFFAVSYKAVWIAGIIVVYLIPNIGMVCYMVWKILKG